MIVGLATADEAVVRENLPAIAIGKNMRMNGPLHFSLSLATATTTVRTVAGTYGGTEARLSMHTSLLKARGLTCV